MSASFLLAAISPSDLGRGSRQLHRELGDWMHAHAGQARRTSQ